MRKVTNVLQPIFKNKGKLKSCSNYRRKKLMSNTMKFWQRVVEARLRDELMNCELHDVFLLTMITTKAMFAFRMLLVKYRKG